MFVDMSWSSREFDFAATPHRDERWHYRGNCTLDASHIDMVLGHVNAVEWSTQGRGIISADVAAVDDWSSAEHTHYL
jgi:hypothetical protein